MSNIANISATFILVERDGKILTLLRAKDGQLGLPGGKVESGETFKEAAMRECREETGYVVLCTDREPYIGYDPVGKRTVACYQAFVLRPPEEEEPTHAHEGETKWSNTIDLIASGYGDYNRRALRHFGVTR